MPTPDSRSLRCGRCLIVVPPTTFLHDCAGEGLASDHYVSRLERELERLGEFLTQHTRAAPTGVAAVDGAIALIRRLGGATVRGGLECWESCGATYCKDCAPTYTGARPVRLEPPRTCRECGKEITDPWPEDENATT